MKNYDKILSTFSFNLEKKYIKNLYSLTLIPPLSAGKIVTCGF